MTEMKQKQQALQDERMALLAKNCLSPSLLKLEYACEKCRDTGYIEGTPCTCMRRRLMDRLYDQSNVRDVIKLENFDTFDLRLFDTEVVPAEGISPKENAQRNLKKAMEFAEHPEGENLLLYGGAGRGKTFLVQLYCEGGSGAWENGALPHGRAAFPRAGDMRFRNKEEEEPFDWDSEILDADLLIIDDLGTEFATMFTASELFRIVNDRKLRKRPVVISTNLDYRALMEQYSDRVMSRLMGNIPH